MLPRAPDGPLGTAVAEIKVLLLLERVLEVAATDDHRRVAAQESLVDSAARWCNCHAVGVVDVVQPLPELLGRGRVELCFAAVFGNKIGAESARTALPLEELVVVRLAQSVHLGPSVARLEGERFGQVDVVVPG